MNQAIVTRYFSILIFAGTVELHYHGVIWKTDQYDKAEAYGMHYLHSEGFLETVDLANPEASGDLYHVENVVIFDGTGKQVIREQLI